MKPPAPVALPRVSNTDGTAPDLDVLVVCNAYPSPGVLYRNGFIHRRVLAYVSAGMRVRVFYHHEPVATPYDYEFEGVSVEVGRSRDLLALLRGETFDAVLVHFAEPGRIQPLIEAQVSCPVLVWVHGFEAEAWHRRWFNFLDSAEEAIVALERRTSYYEEQNAFLRHLVTDEPLDFTWINVSEWFQRMVVEPDIGAEMHGSHVIPNLVDERLFRFEPKEDADRLRVLSIRPFASRKYANDLTVRAIKELSRRPFFGELEFTICGEGRLFEREVADLRDLPNVSLHERFFSQDEIVYLHQLHGVFLAPTRFDSQGVSMCEAMSSGLATISSDVAAIPEFIENRVTGMLAPPESAVGLADAVEELYFDPDLFQQISGGGARRMRSQCGHEQTVHREVALIREKVRRG